MSDLDKRAGIKPQVSARQYADLIRETIDEFNRLVSEAADAHKMSVELQAVPSRGDYPKLAIIIRVEL